MIIRVNSKINAYLKWKPVKPSGEATYRIFEAGYEVCSRFETIWFLTLGRISLMVDVFDPAAAAKAQVPQAVNIPISIPPPPVIETDSGCQIVRFSAHRR